MRRRLLGNRRSGETERAIHFYEFEEGAPTLIDSQGDKDGQIFSTPLLVSGVDGSALQFDGVDDYVLFPDNLGINGFPFSVSFNLKKTNAGDVTRVIQGHSTLYNGIEIVVLSSFIQVSYGNGLGTSASARKSFRTSEGVNDTDWHKISIECVDFDNVNLYKGGLEIPIPYNSGTATSIKWECNYKLMFNQISNEYAPGTLDNLRIYHSLLEENEK